MNNWLTVAIVVGLGLVLLNRNALASVLGVYRPVRYPPNSPELIALLEQAAIAAGLPVWWAREKSAHKLIELESNGWVGRPNYTIPGWNDRKKWPAIIAKLRAGQSVPGDSDAAGLGQLLPSNMKAYAPAGIKGYGDPLQEAIGFLRYVHDRYGSPDVALSVYGKIATYTHGATGKTKKKTFREGY